MSNKATNNGSTSQLNYSMATNDIPVFSGPDGARDCYKKVKDPMCIGIGKQAESQSITTQHITTDHPKNPFPKKSSEVVGGIGWGIKIKEYNEDLIKSGHQLRKNNMAEYRRKSKMLMEER